MISTSTAYRTVSHAVLCVLTGSIPEHIKVLLYRKVYIVKKMASRDIEDLAAVKVYAVEVGAVGAVGTAGSVETLGTVRAVGAVGFLGIVRDEGTLKFVLI